MRRLSIFSIVMILVLILSGVADQGIAAEPGRLVPGGWLTPPRAVPAVADPPPMAPEPPRASAPAIRRKAPPMRPTQPISQPPARLPPPDGKVQF